MFLIYAVSIGLIFAVFMSVSRIGAWTTIITSIIGGLLLGWAGWGFMPVIHPAFPSFWAFLIVVLVFACGVSCIISSIDEFEMPSANKTMILILAMFIVLWGIYSLFSTSPMVRSSDYAELMNKPMESRFVDDVSPVDINRVRQVDEDLARLVAEKRLGEIPGLGSHASVESMNIQVVNGTFEIIDGMGRELLLVFENDLVWAGPLIHSDMFKQFSHRTTPGYILVSAVDPAQVYLVTAVRSNPEEEGNPRMGSAGDGFQEISLRYMAEGAYFRYLLRRHLYINGYQSAGITDITFEIRDDGMPFYVVTRFTKKIGFSGNEAVGVVIVDPQTGAIEEYSINETPEWVDRIQPEEFVRSQIDWQGKYVHGWLNSFIGKRDVRMTTPGMSLVYGADGRAYWYSGIQSAGADQSTMGFVLVDTRTKESRWYKISGATETAVKTAAESAPGVREAEFKATNPILYSILGEPTYFMTLKGDDGLVKMYAFVNVRDYQAIGVGRSVNQALRDYQTALVNLGKSLDVDDLIQHRRIEAVVKEVVFEEGFYYFLLEGHKGKEFYASSAMSPEMKWTRPGDLIVVEVQEGEGNSISIVKFSNPELGF